MPENQLQKSWYDRDGNTKESIFEIGGNIYGNQEEANDDGTCLRCAACSTRRKGNPQPCGYGHENTHDKKRSIGKQIIGMAVLLLIVSLYAAFGSKLEAQAASSKEEYESVEDILTERVDKKVDAGKVVKKGNYYFKYETEEYTDSEGDTSTRKIYYISEYKDKEFRELPSDITTIDLYTNGKNAYYVSGKYLYSYNLKTGEANKLKKVPKVSDSGFFYAGSVGGGYGNVLLIQIWQGEGTADLYSYNIKTKKFTKQKKESYCKGGKGDQRSWKERLL